LYFNGYIISNYRKKLYHSIKNRHYPKVAIGERLAAANCGIALRA
jgi:hypothetical protein